MVRVVIASGPYSGKTTLVKALGEQGFDIVQEAALRVIQKEQMLGNMRPWEERARFQADILALQVTDYQAYTGNVTVFDRGFPDGIAYYWLDDLVPEEALVNAAKSHRYDIIMMPDLLPEYNPGITRGESLEVRERVHGLIRRSYEQHGYEVVSIPVCSTIAQRVEFVKSKIAEFTQLQS